MADFALWFQHEWIVRPSPDFFKLTRPITSLNCRLFVANEPKSTVEGFTCYEFVLNSDTEENLLRFVEEIGADLNLSEWSQVAPPAKDEITDLVQYWTESAGNQKGAIIDGLVASGLYNQVLRDKRAEKHGQHVYRAGVFNFNHVNLDKFADAYQLALDLDVLLYQLGTTETQKGCKVANIGFRASSEAIYQQFVASTKTDCFESWTVILKDDFYRGTPFVGFYDLDNIMRLWDEYAEHNKELGC
ncbi:MAG: hypothetical protein RLP44_26530 [Aggregatilineales bacterium]